MYISRHLLLIDKVENEGENMKEFRYEIAPGVFIDFTICMNYTITNKHSGKKKYKYIVKEQKSGLDFSHKLARNVLKERVIDRRNDYYREEIKDLKNDAFIHCCEEPLSAHYGHGSAKFKNKNKNDASNM